MTLEGGAEARKKIKQSLSQKEGGEGHKEGTLELWETKRELKEVPHERESGRVMSTEEKNAGGHI